MFNSVRSDSLKLPAQRLLAFEFATWSWGLCCRKVKWPVTGFLSPLYIGSHQMDCNRKKLAKIREKAHLFKAWSRACLSHQLGSPSLTPTFLVPLLPRGQSLRSVFWQMGPGGESSVEENKQLYSPSIMTSEWMTTQFHAPTPFHIIGWIAQPVMLPWWSNSMFPEIPFIPTPYQSKEQGFFIWFLQT